MNYKKYKAEANSSFTVYKFISIGIKGEIEKAIQFTLISNSGVYNLAFGDVDFENNKTGEIRINDKIISDNGDRDVVLATVADAVYEFTLRHPNSFVLFRGSTLSRTRLYRMAITKNYAELSETFLIFGAGRNAKGQIVNLPFESNENFEGFLIKRK